VIRLPQAAVASSQIPRHDLLRLHLNPAPRRRPPVVAPGLLVVPPVENADNRVVSRFLLAKRADSLPAKRAKTAKWAPSPAKNHGV
jgi:hypothetical protein